MVMNKKGQTVFVKIGLAVMVFIFIISLIPLLKQEINIARGPTYLDCTNSSIPLGTQATCIFVDFWLFYFVIIGIGSGLAIFSIKNLVQRNTQG